MKKLGLLIFILMVTLSFSCKTSSKKEKDESNNKVTEEFDESKPYTHTDYWERVCQSIGVIAPHAPIVKQKCEEYKKYRDAYR